MKRFLIIFYTEFMAWAKDPITALGGIIPPLFILIAFGLMFGGNLSFKIGLLNLDAGSYGGKLSLALKNTISPLNNNPYYAVTEGSREFLFKKYNNFELDGIWIIPDDFSRRIEGCDKPRIEMYFNNYHDDRAKNHRIYSAEILWQFYKTIGYPGPPVETLEHYPGDRMIDWFPIIAVGAILLAAMVGAMMNIFMLTYKEQISRITMEYALAPYSLITVFFVKTILSLFMGMVSMTVIMAVAYFWTGIWPVTGLFTAYLLCLLVSLFWTSFAMFLGLHTKRYMVGAVISILTGITLFFVSGGMTMVKANTHKILFFSWFFPNIYAVDPLRDIILFQEWPEDFFPVLVILILFALFSIISGWIFSAKRIRSMG
ncbi:MAG: ABC transporter permease [Spirochaetales bacterium]|nr:ABC transporter permease [Spirochaetales bacterium]